MHFVFIFLMKLLDTKLINKVITKIIILALLFLLLLLFFCFLVVWLGFGGSFCHICFFVLFLKSFVVQVSQKN